MGLNMSYNIEELVSIAKEIGMTDEIDFGYLTVDENTAYNVLALSVVENHEKTAPMDREKILLATVIHLLVENMVLNMKARL
jgi:hypothetical protein